MHLPSISRVHIALTVAVICHDCPAQLRFPDSVPLDESGGQFGVDDNRSDGNDSLRSQQAPFVPPGNSGQVPSTPQPLLGEPPAPRMNNPANIRSDFFGVVNTMMPFPGPPLLVARRLQKTTVLYRATVSS